MIMLRSAVLYLACAGVAALAPRVSAQQNPVAGDSVAARPVCVEDAGTGQLSRSDMVRFRLPGDSVVLHDGQRLALSEVQPRVVGFTAPIGGFDADSTCLPLHLQPKYVRVFGRCYTTFASPRTVPLSLLAQAGVLHGATVFLERNLDFSRRYDPILYVLREEDCRFQPYSVPIT